MKKYKFIVDADTILYRNAALCQTNYDVHLVKKGKFVESVRSKKFFVEKAQREGLNIEDYVFIPKVAPMMPANSDKPEIVGFHAFSTEIDKIIERNKDKIEDFRIVLHGEGNFRDDIATIVPYKGNRGPKPLFHKQVKDWVFKKYKDILIVAEGEEADDVCSILLHEDWTRARGKKKDLSVCLAHVDKDLDQCTGYHYNYDKDSYYFVDREEAAYSFYTQLLTGDATDCIPGLMELPPEIRKNFGLKGKGIGPKAAERLLEGCETPKDMMERVVSLYEVQYKDKWYSVMEENCRLLYMRKEVGEMYNLGEKLESMGISYEK